MKEFLIPAVIAVIIAIAFFLGVFGSVSTPSGDNPAVVRAADFATPTAGPAADLTEVTASSPSPLARTAPMAARP